LTRLPGGPTNLIIYSLDESLGTTVPSQGLCPDEFFPPELKTLAVLSARID
jgi:hypothetical protein